MLAGPKKTKHAVFAAFAVSCITLFIYLPALQNGFVNWDDNLYVYDNPNIRSINLRSLKWIFTNIVSSNWHPLTLLSHALDYALYGLHPWGHHLTNIFLHSMNAGFVFLLIYKLVEYGRLAEGRIHKKALITSVTIALLFAIHPLHVESVAWVSERKDVLCAFFFLLSLMSYFIYATVDSKRHYAASLFSFVLALLSKPMAVSLPIVLLIIDFYPLERLKTRKRRDLFIEKVPFFLLSMTSSVVTLWAQSSSGALQPLDVVPFINRIFVAMHTLIFYLYKIALPFNLAPYYPYPASIDFYTPEYLGAFVLLTAITIFSFRSSKLFLTVWLYYVVTLIPVIGIVQVGGQAAADRYTYLPSLGPFLLAGAGVAALYEKLTAKTCRMAVSVMLMIFIGLFSFATVRQISIWQNSITLWTHQIELAPVAFAYYNRGTAYKETGDYQQSIIDQTMAIDLNPRFAKAYINRGNVFRLLGNYRRALLDMDKAIELDPWNGGAYYNRGNIYGILMNYQLAIANYTKTIEIESDSVKAYINRGNAYHALGNHEHALMDLNRAIELDSQNADAYFNRGIVYRAARMHLKAIADFIRAVELNPADASAYNNLAEIYLQADEKTLGIYYKGKAEDLGLSKGDK